MKQKPQTDRNAKIYQYHLKHPKTSLRKIGRIFKMTGQNVWYIIKDIKAKETVNA